MERDPRHGADDPRDARDEALWSRVQAALDAGRDPFADPALAGALRARPTLAARVERLCERLELLALLGPGPALVPERADDLVPGPRATTPVGAFQTSAHGTRWSAGLGAAAAVLLAWATLRGVAPTPPIAPSPTHDGPLGSQVRQAHLELEHSRPEPPAPAVVHHTPQRVVAWTLPGDSR